MPPPTVQNTAISNKRPSGGTSSSSSRTPGKEKPPPDLLLRVRYQNTLPDIPFEPKFLLHPFVDLSRFVGYKQTQLEKSFKYDLLTEPDLGVKIDLINPETYASPGEIEPHPTDAKLLEDEPQNTTDSKRSQQHKRVLPWLRKTELMSSEINRYGVQAERQETKVGYKIKKQLQEQEQQYRSIQDQIAAIERSFVENQVPVTQHHSKRDVYPLEEMHFMPDFDLWKYPFAQVLFDSDPTPIDPHGKAQDKMCQALIRGMMDEEGEQYVAYFLPTDDTLTKIDKEKTKASQPPESTSKETEDGEKAPKEADAEGDGGEKTGEGEEKEKTEKDKESTDEYEYKIAREYHWTVKAKASKGYEQENYFVTLGRGVAAYNELETRVRLTRRRARGEVKTANQRLVVKYRPETTQELNAQQHRIHMLFNPFDEFEAVEEEEEVEAEVETEADQTTAEVDTTAADTTKASSDDNDSDVEADKTMDTEQSSPSKSQPNKSIELDSDESDDGDVQMVDESSAAKADDTNKNNATKSSSSSASSDDDMPPRAPARPVRPTAPKKSMPAMKAMHKKNRGNVSSDDSDSSSDNQTEAKVEKKDSNESSDDSQSD